MNKVLFFFALLLPLFAFPQVGPGVWQDHTSISSAYSVTKRGEMVYASYFNGLIKFKDEELSPEAMSKINGLSDIGIRLLRTNPHNNKLLVIYENSNIDVLDEDDNVTNYAGIKLKTFNGSKIINEVTFDGPFAYLACGFGIIVFDTDKLEIKDSYFIGPEASQLNVNQVAVRDSLVFAATPIGIFKGNKNTILNNFKNWKLDTVSLPKGYYTGVVNVQGNILAFFSQARLNKNGEDTIFQYLNGSWKSHPLFLNKQLNLLKPGPVYKSMFSAFDNSSFLVWDVNTGVLLQLFNVVDNEVSYGTKRDAHIGVNYSTNITHWIADSYFGLYRAYNFFDPITRVNRNGTRSRLVANIDIHKGKVAVSPSYIKNTGNGNYFLEGINVMKDQEWKYLPVKDADGDPVQDITWVFNDRFDTRVMWAASLTYGIIKFSDNKIVKYYNPATTPDMPVAFPSPKYATRCTGISSDKDGNIWFSHAGMKEYLSVIKRNGQYQNFSFDRARGYCRKTFVDKNNYVWMLHEDGEGITVFNHKNFSAPLREGAGANYKILTNSVGEGNLQSKEVYSIAEDKDGKIWIGTAAGISVMYNSAAIFGGGSYDAQPIKIVQDGNVELLLSKEIVSSIVIDGANNKWVGTMQGGVYCFSPDGLKQLHHFTKENSALYSNTVLDMAYDEVTGDVFIGTDAGVQSYRGVVVAGEEKYTDVYAYPNPVKPNYTGKVLIRGLMDNSIVKITDESGNMVWETKSTGGQIEWPIQTFAGNRVTSGVYVVYASTTNGEFKAATKILVIN